MSEDVVRIIMRKVVKALIHCKKKGVLHHDVKEDNILLNPETLEVKVIDFGLSILLKDVPYKAFGEGPLSTEAQSEASWPYSLRPRKENPLKRKMLDLLQEESESQLNERPKKRRRANSPQKEGPLSTETQSEASWSYSLRPRKENPLKRKTVDLLQEESESQLNERPKKRRRANSPQKGPLSTEAQSEASCPYSLRPRKENPLKRKMVDLLQEESESQLKERPKKRRRTNSPQKEGPLSTETQSETSWSYSLRSRKGNPLKRKLTDLFHEEPEAQLMEMRMKRRRNETEETKETKGVLSAEIQSEESCKEETTDLPQEEMPKEQRKPETKKNNIQEEKGHAEGQQIQKADPRWLEMKELLSTYSEPSDSFSTEDHDVSDPQPEDLPDDFTERYTLGELLGSESNAKVYTGIRKSDGEQVAIKYLLKCFVDYFTLPDDTRSLPHEGMMMEFVSRSRSSPYVIKLLEWFETPKGFLLVLERPHNFITLQQFRRGLEGRMSEDVARIIMRKIIQALIHCRECGVLHLDVKEHNILVNPETLDLKLTDFSQARLIYGRTYRAFGDVPIRLSFDGLSKACCELINGCLQEDFVKRPNYEGILSCDWCQVKDPSRE
ncbi:hypothetical protein KOW79_016779 [Hemibagrus wyckioides]|uniref:Serine/threonine-protein kinase 1 n=1 Tax=Hemibagrus wyckioides TaxID=337641 RepID=A0A9D3NBC3_9TELE|nr:hypothetical protein KOW79_016779 [Hemibagrus wyckioides]